MRTHYPDQIRESAETLEQLERSLRGQALCDRVKMLRLLKTGVCDSRRTLAPILGYSERQLQRWWKTYKRGGLDLLLEEKAIGGSTERMTDAAWNALKREMREGRVQQLKEAQDYLLDRFGIEYQSLQGLSDMIKRRSIADLMRERRRGDGTTPAPSEVTSFSDARAAIQAEEDWTL
ncbi:MAG: helix-turn-helix domain-containing protein [Rhodothermales bacterium]|nr:helix-turn-helix domain-containing protein [Rhodothermales bacterium]